MKDLQLAIAVARVYEGDNGPVLRSLLKQTILPQAAMNGDRWQATWAFWLLGQQEMAMKALMVSSTKLTGIHTTHYGHVGTSSRVVTYIWITSG